MYKIPDIHEAAQKRVRSKAKFYKHLFFYVVFNGLFFTTALFQGNPMAPLTVAFFWGIGLVSHYLKVFGMPGSGVLSHEWEDREYRRELERLKGQSKTSILPDEQLELREMSKKYRDSDLV